MAVKMLGDYLNQRRDFRTTTQKQKKQQEEIDIDGDFMDEEEGGSCSQRWETIKIDLRDIDLSGDLKTTDAARPYRITQKKNGRDKGSKKKRKGREGQNLQPVQ